MKNVFILTFVVLFLVAGCSKKSKPVELKDPSTLNEDKDFGELVNETHTFVLFLANKVKENSLSLDKMQTQLGQIQSEMVSFSEQMNSVDKIFKGSVSPKLAIHMKLYSTVWKKIQAEYSSITLEILTRECSEVLQKIYLAKSNDNITSQKAVLVVDDCGWRYFLCAAAATAGAILCHAACDTTALATTAGAGIPACVALCGTIQAFAIVQCKDSYC